MQKLTPGDKTPQQMAVPFVTMMDIRRQQELLQRCITIWESIPFHIRASLLKRIRDANMDDLTMRAHWGGCGDFRPLATVRFDALPNILRDTMTRNMKRHDTLYPVTTSEVH